MSLINGRSSLTFGCPTNRSRGCVAGGLRVKVPRRGIGGLAYVVDEVKEKHVIISGDGC